MFVTEKYLHCEVFLSSFVLPRSRSSGSVSIFVRFICSFKQHLLCSLSANLVWLGQIINTFVY